MTIANRQKPAPGELFLDHVSHFVPDLDAAAAVLERLGFAVTPVSIQKTSEGLAGASNRCVMLEEGYLELLTPTHDTPTANRMRERLAKFTGVHLACFGTPDAEGEHARLAAHGYAPAPLVNLERKAEGGNTVRFKVVRPAPESMPEGRIQYVQQMTPEAIWTGENLAHGNGVTGLKALYVVADDPAATAARWAQFAGLLPGREGELVRLETSRGRVLIGTREVLAGLLGEVPPAPALAGYALACTDPRQFAARCAANRLSVQEKDGRYAVALPAALGGAWLLGG